MHMIQSDDGDDHDLDETKTFLMMVLARRVVAKGSEYALENNISERAPLAYVMRAKCEFSRKIHHP